jgi:tetratricopeptide (TPR) repeat protein
MDATFTKNIEAGIAAHRDGRLEDALVAYRAALEAAPDDAEAASLTGLVLLHLGRTDEAGPLLRGAAEREPDAVGLQLNVAEYLEKTGDPAQAASRLQRALRAQPKAPRAWERLGDLYVTLQHLNPAAEAYGRALALVPQSFSAAIKFARVLAALRDFPNAIQALGRASALRPNDESVLEIHAKILTVQQDWKSLEALSRFWTQNNPASALGWRTLASTLLETGLPRQAVDAYRKALDLAPRSAEALSAFAAIALQAQDVDAAAAALAEAELSDREHPAMLATKATLLTYRGQLGEAESYCRRALARDPQNVPAYTMLSLLTHGRFSESETAAVARIAKDAGFAPEPRILAGFALANALDAKGDVDAAFAAYAAAHVLRRESNTAQGLTYNPAEAAKRVDTLLSLYPAAKPGLSAPAPGPRPIFVVGMPRSGTTLVESILAAHSRVAAFGERPRMQQILSARLAMAAATPPQTPDDAALEEWVQAYYRDVEVAGGIDVMIDKFPLNFEACGLILQMFPGAVIVHTRRDPLETGLSIFRHEAPKFWTFANRLEDIGHYYAQYARLVQHWERTLGPRFVGIQYEDLVENFDAVAPKLVAVCGLEWEAGCADFQNISRDVATFSAVQVREPLKNQNGRAALYAEHLVPLMRALEAGNVDLKTGARRSG